MAARMRCRFASIIVLLCVFLRESIGGSWGADDVDVNRLLRSLELGNALLKKQRFDEALVLLEDFLSHSPVSGTEAKLAISEALIGLQRWPELVFLHRKMLEESQDVEVNAKLYQGLCLALVQLEEFEEAKEYCRKAEEILELQDSGFGKEIRMSKEVEKVVNQLRVIRPEHLVSQCEKQIKNCAFLPGKEFDTVRAAASELCKYERDTLNNPEAIWEFSWFKSLEGNWRQLDGFLDAWKMFAESTAIISKRLNIPKKLSLEEFWISELLERNFPVANSYFSERHIQEARISNVKLIWSTVMIPKANAHERDSLPIKGAKYKFTDGALSNLADVMRRLEFDLESVEEDIWQRQPCHAVVIQMKGFWVESPGFYYNSDFLLLGSHGRFTPIPKYSHSKDMYFNTRAAAILFPNMLRQDVWLVEGIPRVLLLKERVLDLNPELKLVLPFSNFISESLRFVGVDESRILWIPSLHKTRYYFSDVYVAEYAFYDQKPRAQNSYSVSAVPLDLLWTSRLFFNYYHPHEVRPEERNLVLILEPSFADLKSLKNVDSVLKFIRPKSGKMFSDKYDFLIINADKMSVDEMIDHFRHAALIVGPPVESWGFMLFSSPGTALLEISELPSYGSWIPIVGQSLGHVHFLFGGEAQCMYGTFGTSQKFIQEISDHILYILKERENRFSSRS